MATYFVRTSGNDNNNGTAKTSAWATIGKALATAGTGDVVWIGAGTYTEDLTARIGLGLTLPVLRGDVNGLQTGDAGIPLIDSSSFIPAPAGGTNLIFANNGVALARATNVRYLGPLGTVPQIAHYFA